MMILVAASTFPKSDTDPVPSFVRDQIENLKTIDPSLHFSVLAPANAFGKTLIKKSTGLYDEYRFHYFPIRRLEKLAGRGILPTLKQNPFLAILIPSFLFAGLFGMLRLAKTIKPDLLWAHWFTPQGIQAYIVSRICKIPFAFTTHASDVSILRVLPYSRVLVKRVCRQAVWYTAVSSRTLGKLESFLSPIEIRKYRAKCAIIPMGTFGIESNVEEKPEKQDKCNILFLGRLAEKKGVRYLIEAVEMLSKETKSKIKVTIAGDGQLRSELVDLANNIGCEVDFVGYVSGEVKERAIRGADIVCIPSIIGSMNDSEGLPVVLLEALAHGKICISSDVSGAETIIEDGVSGFIFEQKNKCELSLLIEKVLMMDVQEKKYISQNALELPRQFTWDAVNSKYYSMIMEKM